MQMMELQMTTEEEGSGGQNAEYRVEVVSSAANNSAAGHDHEKTMGSVSSYIIGYINHEEGGGGGGDWRGRKGMMMMMISQVSLRGVVVALTLASIIITISAKQTVSLGMLTFQARYSYSSAIRFQVGANAVVCAFSFLSMLLIIIGIFFFIPPPTRPNYYYYYYFYLLLHDMVMTMLIISGCAAASTVGYLAKNGQQQGSWIAFCTYLPNFCNQLQLALLFAYLAFLCMFLLTILAAASLLLLLLLNSSSHLSPKPTSPPTTTS